MYCDVDRVRMLTGISETAVTDNDLELIINYAMERVNADVSKRVVLEYIAWIDNYRQNRIDGSNTTYYVSRSWNWFLFDYDDDGKFRISDIEVWDCDPVAMTRTQVIPSTIDVRGSFTLSTAIPQGHEIYVSYRYCPLTIYPTVDPLIADATAYLSGALANTKLNPGDYRQVQIGRLMYKGIMGPAQALMEKYNELVKRIDYINFEAAKPGIRYASMDLDDAITMADQDRYIVRNTSDRLNNYNVRSTI